MFSKLSAGVTNAKYFNQAARNVACITEVACRAGIGSAALDDIAFYVVAPKVRIDEGVFATEMTKDDIRETVQRRVSEYEDQAKQQWFDEWFFADTRYDRVALYIMGRIARRRIRKQRSGW